MGQYEFGHNAEANGSDNVRVFVNFKKTIRLVY